MRNNKTVFDFGGYTRVRDWYLAEFPDDKLGESIDEKLSFNTLYKQLEDGKDIYEVIPADSIIRERCFLALANILKVDYTYIYRLWMATN